MDAYSKALDMPTVQECRERIHSLRAEKIKARALCESACDLRQYNAELRELLRETVLTAQSRYERWMEDWLDRRSF